MTATVVAWIVLPAGALMALCWCAAERQREDDDGDGGGVDRAARRCADGVVLVCSGETERG